MIRQDIYEGEVGYLPSPMYYTRRGLVGGIPISGLSGIALPASALNRVG
jgi:hypothetical protein